MHETVAMQHHLSADDREFSRALEAGEIAPGDFNHAAHVRLAYVYLVEGSVEEAAARLKDSLLALLQRNGIDAAKYHATLTRAWIMAVDHFMRQSDRDYASAGDFMRANPQLLDSRIMLTHYSAEVLFSPDARQDFVQPDLQAIPPP
jgi:hypothetical protein